MKAAEEIMEYYGIEMQNFIASSHWLAVKMAINEARKDTIIECAERAKAFPNATHTDADGKMYGIVDKQSILSLINELK